MDEHKTVWCLLSSYFKKNMDEYMTNGLCNAHIAVSQKRGAQR